VVSAFWATLHLFQDRKNIAGIAALAIAGLGYQAMTEEATKFFLYVQSAFVPVAAVVLPIFIFQIGRQYTLLKLTQSFGLILDDAVTHYFNIQMNQEILNLAAKISAVGQPMYADNGVQLSWHSAVHPEDSQRLKWLRSERRASLMRKLKAGELVATGIPITKNKREIIPPDVWVELAVDIKTSTAKGGGLEYSQIRVRTKP
jgi:hypothetical protein